MWEAFLKKKRFEIESPGFVCSGVMCHLMIAAVPLHQEHSKNFMRFLFCLVLQNFIHHCQQDGQNARNPIIIFNSSMFSCGCCFLE